MRLAPKLTPFYLNLGVLREYAIDLLKKLCNHPLMCLRELDTFQYHPQIQNLNSYTTNIRARKCVYLQNLHHFI